MMGRSTQKNAGFQGVIAKEGLQTATEQQTWRARHSTGLGQRTSRRNGLMPKRCGTNDNPLNPAIMRIWRWIRVPLESLGCT